MNLTLTGTDKKGKGRGKLKCELRAGMLFISFRSIGFWYH